MIKHDALLTKVLCLRTLQSEYQRSHRISGFSMHLIGSIHFQ